MTKMFGNKDDPNSISKPGPDSSEPSPVPEKAPPAQGGGKVGLVQFIDVSHYQPSVNWDNVVKAGFQAAVAKAVDGAGPETAMFSKHAANAKAKGLPFGAYCFGRFHTSPTAQADNFAKIAEKHTRWIVLDVEWDRSSATKAKFGDKYGEGGKMDEFAAVHALTCLERLEQLGFHPWIYSNTYYFTGFKAPERFSRFPYWASNYQQKTKAVKDLDVSRVPLPKPYKKCVAWQYSDRHPAAKSITGDANLDANVYFGDIADLRKLAGGQ